MGESEIEQLRRFNHQKAEALDAAHLRFERLASYCRTVRLDRRKVVDGNIMCLQTEDWCKGLLEAAEGKL